MANTIILFVPVWIIDIYITCTVHDVSSTLNIAYTCIDVIGPEKAEFLIELLDTVGRKDLSAIVREYIDKVDRESVILGY